MPVIVMIRFDVDLSRLDEIGIDELNWAHLEAAARKAGARNYHQIVRPGVFIDIDEYPSIEAYKAFKLEAKPVIDEFETRLGVKGIEEFWEISNRRGA